MAKPKGGPPRIPPRPGSATPPIAAALGGYANQRRLPRRPLRTKAAATAAAPPPIRRPTLAP